MTQSSEQSTIWLTPKTLDRLQGELEERTGAVRAELVERIASSRDEGDLKENGGYHAAKDEQGKNEARIRQLEDMLRAATTETSADDGVVSPGKVVSYRYAGDDEVEQLLLGARDIAEDESEVEVISPQSPLGGALLGAARGQTVDFAAPNGKQLKIEIVDAVPYAG